MKQKLAKVKRFFFLIWAMMVWEILGLDGITFNEFKALIKKEFCTQPQTNQT